MRLGRGTRRLGSALLLLARARFGSPSLGAVSGARPPPRLGVRRFSLGPWRSLTLIGMRRGRMSIGMRRDCVGVGQRLH